MVAFTRAVLTLASLVGFVAAQQNLINILQPGGSFWWVANSDNDITWDCRNTTIQNFTVLISNSNPAILSGNLAIVGIEPTYDCSLLVDKTLVNFTATTGYTVLFGNPLNNTQIYGQSQPFEIKSLGAAYPASTLSVSATANGGSATGSGASATATHKSSASKFAAPGALAGLLVGSFASLMI